MAVKYLRSSEPQTLDLHFQGVPSALESVVPLVNGGVAAKRGERRKIRTESKKGNLGLSRAALSGHCECACASNAKIDSLDVILWTWWM